LFASARQVGHGSALECDSRELSRQDPLASRVLLRSSAWATGMIRPLTQASARCGSVAGVGRSGWHRAIALLLDEAAEKALSAGATCGIAKKSEHVVFDDATMTRLLGSIAARPLMLLCGAALSIPPPSNLMSALHCQGRTNWRNRAQMRCTHKSRTTRPISNGFDDDRLQSAADVCQAELIGSDSDLTHCIHHTKVRRRQRSNYFPNTFLSG